MRRRALLSLLLALEAASLLSAASRFHARSARRSSAITLRRRLNVQPLITDPGTVEFDWGNLLSTSTWDDSLPTAFRLTPEGRHPLWGRSEFSVNFDALESFHPTGPRVNHFGDRITAAATTVVLDREHFDMAAGPQATFLMRADRGLRAGAFLIGRADWGRNSAGFTANWTAATAPTETNPAATLDAGFGGGRRLATSGFAGHLTAHGNYLWERSTGARGFHSLFEGLECQINDRLSIDVTAQHIGLGNGSTADHQILAGITVNLGRYRRRPAGPPARPFR